VEHGKRHEASHTQVLQQAGGDIAEPNQASGSCLPRTGRCTAQPQPLEPTGAPATAVPRRCARTCPASRAVSVIDHSRRRAADYGFRRGPTMATGATASDPFSRSAQHGHFRPRRYAASGRDDRHHAGLLPRAEGALRSPPGAQRGPFRNKRRSADAGHAEGDA
jgi:hypothetical protein